MLAMPKCLDLRQAIHRWLDEIEKKDTMNESFIRFSTYLNDFHCEGNCSDEEKIYRQAIIEVFIGQKPPSDKRLSHKRQYCR